VRRIGNGVDTNIWGWPWLADTRDPKLFTPCIPQLCNAKVSGLMSANGTWDVGVLNDLFIAADVDRILATLVSLAMRDSWRWKGDLKGIYSVKHGYRILTQPSNAMHSATEFTAWDKIWKLPVPPKVRNLIWRCVRNILPVRENLKSKRIWIGGGCVFCDSSVETIEHLFCECIVACQVWSCSDVLQGRGFAEFVETKLLSTDVQHGVRMAAIIWCLWQMRNDVVWRGGTWSVNGLHAQVETLCVLWQGSNRSKITGTPTVVRTQWSPPPVGRLKCNVDAAVFGSRAGFGAVVRNHDGAFVAAVGGQLECGPDPYLAEAMAVREALSWLKGLSLLNIDLESDCLNLCTAYNSLALDLSYVGLVVKQCQLIANDMGIVCVRHIGRSANQIAHALARAIGSSSVPISWVNSPPACISDFFD